jgi:ribosome recycling factor
MPLDPDEILMNAEEGMEKAVDYMTHEFAAIRTGKASPALVENIDVMCYGTVMKLKQCAAISSPEPRMLVLDAFDPGTVQAIEKAINESKIGISPVVAGKIIRLPIPALSEERRRDLVKTCKNIAEETRVRIRGARREGMDGLKKAKNEGSITEDDIKNYEKDVQKLTDDFVKKVDEAFTAKDADIMKV